MSNLHELIMGAVKRNGTTQPQNVTKPKDKDKDKDKDSQSLKGFRISNGLTLTASKALFDQLNRFCEANPRNDKPMSRSKAIRLAVYAAIQKPNTIRAKPRLIPTVTLAPDRTQPLSWTFPNSTDRNAFDAICKASDANTSSFTRRAIYIYTKEYASQDRNEHIQAASDGWVE
jgi:hypothetical protein